MLSQNNEKKSSIPYPLALLGVRQSGSGGNSGNSGGANGGGGTVQTGTGVGTGTGSGAATGTGTPPVAPSGLNYANSPFSFLQGSAITTLTPTINGTVTSCSSIPALPTGLTLNNTTCAISGTPTTWQAATSHTITATNSGGNITANLNIQVTSDGSTWTARTLPSSQNWSSVTFGNGIFLAVSSGSNVAATSSNGTTWTARTLPSSQQWSSVTFGNGIFVSVATSSNVAATSPDGINWTSRTLPSVSGWRTVGYGNGIFVSLGGGAVASSQDSIIWTSGTNGCPMMAGNCSESVVYGNGVFVGIGNGGISSSDGSNWTFLTTPISGMFGVAFGNGTFVAMDTHTGSATSMDGINWVSGTNVLAGQDNLAFGNGIFLSVIRNTNTAISSPDAVTWTTRTLPSNSEWSSVAYGNGRFVTIARGPSNIAASSP